MKLFTMAKNTTGEGKDMKTEFQFAGNVGMIEAQQMLTEIIIATSKAEGVKQAGRKEGSKE